MKISALTGTREQKLAKIKSILNTDIILRRDELIEHLLDFYLQNDIPDLFQDFIGTRYFLADGSVKEIDFNYLEILLSNHTHCVQIMHVFNAKKMAREGIIDPIVDPVVVPIVDPIPVVDPVVVNNRQIDIDF